MDWIKALGRAIDYIEENITEELNASDIATKVHISAFYFQKGFSMLCGYTVGEYIRMRRLSLAGSELLSSNIRVIDLAFKYGYDSPDSFTKAFIRFHGSTPTEVRKNGAAVKSFAPLRIKYSLDGGTVMEYRIEEKQAFKVMGISRMFSYESANSDIPAFWDEEHVRAKEKKVLGMYGICYDEEMAGNQFKYMIADDLKEEAARKNGLEIYEIPAHKWAIFPCRGAMPVPLQELNKRIFSEWLPQNKYEIAAGYNIEHYSDPANYENGMQDSEYYTELWIPVREKQ